MISRFAAVVDWGKSGQRATDALLTHDWWVRTFNAHGGQSLLLDDVAGVDVYVDGDPEALTCAVVRANLDLIAVSPSIPTCHPVFSVHEVISVEVWDEVKLTWRLQEEDPYVGHPWLIVTGTDGETTTVGMFDEILRCAGTEAEEVGNIGTPVTRTIDSDAEVFTVELFSFWLHAVCTISPLVSICLNMDADHPD